MKPFVMLSAILAWVFGGALLFATAAFVAPMGIAATPAVAVLGQAQGAILVGLGAINWLSRNASGQAIRTVLAGNLVVQIASLLVIVRALAVGAVPMQNAAAVGIHALLGGGFLYFLRKSGRPTIAMNARQVSSSR